MKTSRRFVCSSIDRPSSVSHRIAASRRGQAGFSAAKSAPQFKFIIGLLQDLEMLGVGGHQTPDTGPLQVSHSTSNRIKEQVQLKRSFWSRSNKKRISVHNSSSMFTMCWSGIVSCFLVRALAHVTTSHPCPLVPPDQTKEMNQVKLRIFFDYANVHRWKCQQSKVLTNACNIWLKMWFEIWTDLW